MVRPGLVRFILLIHFTEEARPCRDFPAPPPIAVQVSPPVTAKRRSSDSNISSSAWTRVSSTCSFHGQNLARYSQCDREHFLCGCDCGLRRRDYSLREADYLLDRGNHCPGQPEDDRRLCNHSFRLSHHSLRHKDNRLKRSDCRQRRFDWRQDCFDWSLRRRDYSLDRFDWSLVRCDCSLRRFGWSQIRFDCSLRGFNYGVYRVDYSL